MHPAYYLVTASCLVLPQSGAFLQSAALRQCSRPRPPICAIPQGVPSLLDAATNAMDRGELARAERLLMEARSLDPNRDLPEPLYNAFVRLFRTYATETAHTGDLWPLEGLAALHTDAEDWEACLAACTAAEARAAPGCNHIEDGSRLSVSLRTKQLHARRAAYAWDFHMTGFKGDGSFGDYVKAEAQALAELTAPSQTSAWTIFPPLPPFTALSLPLSPSMCSNVAWTWLNRAVDVAQSDLIAAASSSFSSASLGSADLLPPPPRPPGPSEPLVVGFITPDANGAHPLGQLMAGVLRHFTPEGTADIRGSGFESGRDEVSEPRKAEYDNNLRAEPRGCASVLFALCQHDGSSERYAFEQGARAVIDATGWSASAVAAEVRRQGCHVLVDLTGHAGTSRVMEVMALRPAALQIAGAMGYPGPMGGAYVQTAEAQRTSDSNTPDLPGNLNVAAQQGKYEDERGRLRVYDLGLCDAVVVPDEALARDLRSHDNFGSKDSPSYPLDDSTTSKSLSDSSSNNEASSSLAHGMDDEIVGAKAWGWGNPGEHHALRLPNTYFVTDHAREDDEAGVDNTLNDDGSNYEHTTEAVHSSSSVWARPPPLRADYGLPDNAVVLTCMNRGHKVDPDTFKVWCRVLARTQGTVLWLLAPHEGKSRERLLATAANEFYRLRCNDLAYDCASTGWRSNEAASLAEVEFCRISATT